MPCIEPGHRAPVAIHTCSGEQTPLSLSSKAILTRSLHENRHSISLGDPSLGRRCHCIFPRRLFLSLAEDWCEHVEGMAADEHGQFEDRAPICGGDSQISRVEFCLSRDQVGDVGRSHRIPHLRVCLFVSTMMLPHK